MRKHDEPIKELGDRTWAELEAIPSDSGHMLVRDQVRERDPKTGEWRAIPVRVRIPRPADSLQARSDARVWFGKLKGLDPDRDRDVFDEVEQLCLLSRAIREAEPPHAQMWTSDELASKCDEASLQDVLGRIAIYRQQLDPREPAMTEDDLWRKVLAVAKAGHLGPLTDIAGPDQPSFVIFTARQALLSPMGQSWLQSLETSTLEQESTS